MDRDSTTKVADANPNLVVTPPNTSVMDAMAMAEELATRSPDAIRAAKKLVDQAWAEPEKGLRLEAELQAAIIRWAASKSRFRNR